MKDDIVADLVKLLSHYLAYQIHHDGDSPTLVDDPAWQMRKDMSGLLHDYRNSHSY